MLRIVIQGTYYKDSPRYDRRNSRQKKECVYFYDYDECIGYIIQHMDYSNLQKLRLNIYREYQKLIKFTKFGELDKDGNKFEGYKLQSPIIDIYTSDFAKLIPDRSIRDNYFEWDNVREKYFLRSKFINYVQLNVI